MIDLNSIIAELLLEYVSTKVIWPWRAYQKYLDSVRFLLSQIVRRARQSRVGTPYGGAKGMAHTYFRFIREYRSYLDLLLPGDERERYQKHAVSSEYHYWWGLYFYWLGHDRQDVKAFEEAAKAFENVSARKSTLQKVIKHFWPLASCEVHKAVLLQTKENRERAKNYLQILGRQIQTQQTDPKTRQKMYGAIGYLWTKLIGQVENAYNNAHAAYKEADKGLAADMEPHYTDRLHQLEKNREQGAYRRSRMLTLSSHLPGLAYIGAALWAATCIVLYLLWPWRFFSEAPQTLWQADLPLAPIFLVIVFLIVGCILLYAAFQGIWSIRSGLFTTSEPDPEERSASPLTPEPEAQSPEKPRTLPFFLTIKRDDASKIPQKIEDGLCIVDDGWILRSSEKSGRQIVGSFRVSESDVLFKPELGTPWNLIRNSDKPKEISAEGIIIHAGDRICANSVSDLAINGKVFEIAEFDTDAK